jgi:hypothetical protein
VNVHAVRRGHGVRWRTVSAWVLTCLAGALVLAALDLPNDLRALEPGAFLRVPLEALVYLAVVLALPRRLGRVRTVLALLGGLLLGVTAVFKGLDMGFLAALDRPFDPLVDWRYTRPLLSLSRASFGDGLGTTLLLAAGVTAVLLLVLVPMAVLRVTRVAARHRGSAAGALAVVATLWVALALSGVRTSGGAVAASDNAPYVYDQLTRIPPELRDQRRFAAATEEEPDHAPATSGLLSGLRGKNVLFVFVESYGKVALDGSWFSPGVNAVLDDASRDLGAAGFATRSAWFTSPTFGGISWLAHSTLQSGLWVDSQQRYDILLESPRMTLSRYFGKAGWRTVDVVPANDRDWPEGRFYGYDHVYDSRNIGYEGPRFGYPTMPDQFTLAAFERLELARDRRRPVMAEIDLLNSHTPWSRTPRMVAQSSVGDGSVFVGMPATLPSETDIWPSPRRVQEAYGRSIQYSLTALTRFITTSLDDDTVVVFLGDHQPSTIVSGEDAGHEVPVTIVARDRDVLDAITSWRWTAGLRPTADSPVWRMDQFRDRFLAAYRGAR